MKSLRNSRTLVVVFTLLLSFISQWAIADTSDETNPPIDELIELYYRKLPGHTPPDYPPPKVEIIYEFDDKGPFHFDVKVFDGKSGKDITRNSALDVYVTGEIADCYTTVDGFYRGYGFQEPYLKLPVLDSSYTEQGGYGFDIQDANPVMFGSLADAKRFRQVYGRVLLNYSLFGSYMLHGDHVTTAYITVYARVKINTKSGVQEVTGKGFRKINFDHIAKVVHINHYPVPEDIEKAKVYIPVLNIDELTPLQEAKIYMNSETVKEGMKLRPYSTIWFKNNLNSLRIRWIGGGSTGGGIGIFRPNDAIGDGWAKVLIQPTVYEQENKYRVAKWGWVTAGNVGTNVVSNSIAALVAKGVTAVIIAKATLIGAIAGVVATAAGWFEMPYTFTKTFSCVVVDAKEVLNVYLFEGSAQIFENNINPVVTLSEGEMVTRNESGAFDGPKKLDTKDLTPQTIQSVNDYLSSIGKAVLSLTGPSIAATPPSKPDSKVIKHSQPPTQPKPATPPSGPSSTAVPAAKLPPDYVQTLKSPTKPKPYEGQLPTPPFPQREVVQQYDNGTINWSKGTITAVGIGAPPPNAVNVAQARAMARRAAIVVARRNLLELVQGVQIDSMTLVKEAVVQSDIIRTSIQGVVRNAQIVDTDYMSDGSVEVKVAMNMSGQLANTILPQHSPAVPWATGPSVTTVTPETLKPSSDIITGLVVDARGLGARPAMSPKIVDETGKEIYGSAMVNRQYAVQQGMAGYSRDLSAAQGNSRVTANSLTVKGLRSVGPGKSDIVISNSDASRILSAAENLLFMQKCRVMIVVD